MQGVRNTNDNLEPWLMFEVEPYTDTSVRVHAGAAMRWAAGALATLSMGIDGPSTSYDPDDYLTVNVAASGYLIIGLDDDVAPTTLTASWSATWPSGTEKTSIPVAAVTVADGAITEVWQMHTGVWFSFWAKPDNNSLAYEDTDLDLEIKGWQDIAATTPLAGTEEWMYRPADNSNPGWGSAFDLVDSISDWTGITISGATLSGVECIWNHDELLDIVAATCGDDHNALGADTGNYPYVSPRGDATRIGNQFLALTCLADAAGEDSIRPNERQCFDTDGATIIFDWAAHQLYFDDGGLAIDWDTTDVVSIPNTVIFKVLDITDTNGSTTGAIIVDGGGLFKKNIASLVQIEINAGAKVHIAENDCLFTVDTDFDVHATDDIILHATGDLDLEFAVLNINGAEWETCLVGDLTDSDLVLRKKP